MHNDGWVTIARVVKVRGNKGEVAAEALSDHPERFGQLKSITARTSAGEQRPLEVESVWEHKDRFVFKFRGIDSISAAEPLEGAQLQVPESERIALPEGEYFHSDLIGCEVVDRGVGAVIGRVSGIEEYGGAPLLEVSRDGAEALLIPFVSAICVRIDPAQKRIEVNLPEGLENLNRDFGS